MRKLKTFALILAVTFVGLLFCVKAEAADVAINATNFPNATFRNYVKNNFDTNKDGKLSAAEIKNAKEVDVAGKNIDSLKGVEYLTCLETLRCGDNKLEKLDVSKNPNLLHLFCQRNKLKTLNISNNEKLTIAYYYYEEDELEAFGGYSYIFYEDMSEADDDADPYDYEYALYVDASTKILTHPMIFSPYEATEVTVKAGKKVSLKVRAEGPNLKYQWYYKKPGSNKLIKVSSKAGKKATYTFKTAARHDGYRYVCKVTNKYGSETSEEIKLNVTVKPKITSPKKATTKTVALGKQASFKVKATGASTYQWEYRVTKNDPWQQVTLASGKTANLKVTVQQRHNGHQYRCKVMNSGGLYVYSKIFTLKVKS